MLLINLAVKWKEKSMRVDTHFSTGERGGSVVECRTPEREVGGSIPTAAVLCPWARHFTPRKYWLITQEAVAPSRHDWKIVDWDVKPQHKQTETFLQVSPVDYLYEFDVNMYSLVIFLYGWCCNILYVYL